MFGLPVSTTHVLSSGVAGTMAANGSGLQMATVRNLLMAWVLTLPAAICCRQASTCCSRTCSEIGGAAGSLPRRQQPRRVTEGRSQTPAFCFPRGDMPDSPCADHSHSRHATNRSRACQADQWHHADPRSHSRGNARQLRRGTRAGDRRRSPRRADQRVLRPHRRKRPSTGASISRSCSACRASW